MSKVGPSFAVGHMFPGRSSLKWSNIFFELEFNRNMTDYKCHSTTSNFYKCFVSRVGSQSLNFEVRYANVLWKCMTLVLSGSKNIATFLRRVVS